MKASFNVLDRGWIPVIDEDGSRRLLGIRQILAEAHTLKEISDPSPLEEYSIYRFLCVFLMDALRPKKKSDIRALLKAGRFDMPLIEQYIAQCLAEGVSFDLFDEERPFLQSKYDEALDGKEKPVAVLDCTVPSGNNHMHFVHKPQDNLTPDAAFRKTLATYWFCTAAAQGYPSGVYAAPPYFGVIHDDHLFGTLVTLLLPTDMIGIEFDDPPVLWRRTTAIAKKAEIAKTSWLQGMLFPTRRIHLNASDEAVVSVFLSQGENYVNKESWQDPHVTYKAGDTSVYPMRPHADAPIWRNICDIIDIPGNHASKILNLYKEIHGSDANVAYSLYGVETNQASYLSVQRHDLTLPLRLAEQDRIDLLHTCVSAANQLTKTLRKALSGIETVPQGAVSDAVQKYEQYCENSFWQLCEQANAPDATMQTLFSDFVTDISNALRMEYDAALALLRLRAHALSSAEENRKKLYFEIQKLKKEANT